MRTTLHHGALTLTMVATIAIAGCSGSDTAGPQLPTVSTSPTTSANPADTGSGATGPGAAGAPSDGAGPVSTDPDEAMVQYDRCMSEHGVEMMSDDGIGPEGASVTASDDGQPQSNGASLEDVQKADEACKQYLDAAIGEVKEDPALEAELADEQLDVAKCLHEKGFDVTVDQNGTINGDIDPGKGPEFEAALAECEQEVGAP